MKKLFGDIYASLFEDFFGMDLANYLWDTNIYLGVGLSMVLISLALVIVFYYGVNHPKLNHWWGWLIFFVGNAGINFLIGWQETLSDLYSGNMVMVDPASGETTPLEIYPSNTVYFGLSNMFLAMVMFIIFTLILKWWSSNCSRAPFVR